MILSTPIPPEEGIGNYVYNLSKELLENKHEVTVITRGRFDKTIIQKVDGLRVIKPTFLPAYPFYIKLHGLFLNRQFKKFEKEFDIVHIHSPLCPLVKTSLPIIATIHTPMLADTKTRFEETADFHARIERFMGKYISFPVEMGLINRAEKITTVANSVASELKDYNLNKEEIEVIGNGVDEDIFKPIDNKSDENYILYTGRLDYRKGLFDLIESSKSILDVYPNVSFFVTGKGILLNQLKKRVNELGVSDNFKFLGYVSREKLITLYQNATIYVMPSHYEGLPTVLLEAMSSGCPVVATSVSGNLDVLTNDLDGLLVPPKSPKKIAESVIDLLNNEDKRIKMGNAARKTIEERFTWDMIAKRYMVNYENLLK